MRNALKMERLYSAGTRARTLLHSGSGVVTRVNGFWITHATGSLSLAQFSRLPVLLFMVQVLNQRLYEGLGSAGSIPVELAPLTVMMPPGNQDTIPEICQPPSMAPVSPLLFLKIGRVYVL